MRVFKLGTFFDKDGTSIDVEELYETEDEAVTAGFEMLEEIDSKFDSFDVTEYEKDENGILKYIDEATFSEPKK